MALARSAGPNRPLSEINVTPFVDVMLVLLIIFMVTAPLMQQGIDVDLPDTTTQPLRLRDEPLILTVQKDGKVYLARTPVPMDALEAKIKAIFDGRERKDIYLRADEETPYGVVAQAMGAARRAGARTLGIVTDPEGS
ncbi:MAG: biopolymer transporter ExbD [Myxococcota bacterium]